MATLEIPVNSNSPAYRFQVVLENKTYWFEFSYNTRMNRWIMDIENQAQEPLILGVVVFSGTVLLDGYTIEGLPPGALVCLDETGQGRNPERDNFGSDLKLYYRESIDG